MSIITQINVCTNKSNCTYITHIVDTHKKGIISHLNTHIFVCIHKYN